MNILVAVLTSYNHRKLDRCIKSIPKTYHTEVFCNTLNKKYYHKASQVCKDNSVNLNITDSNGTPGKGKNSVLDYFEKSSYDYLIPIDGDDYFFPKGIDIIVETIKKHKTDVLGLENSYATIGKKFLTVKEYEQDFTKYIDLSKDLTFFTQFLQIFNTNFNNTNNSVANFHRIIAHSKTGLENYRYDENIVGCEDMLLSLQLKKLDKDNKLNFHIYDNNNNRLHCYDINDVQNGCSGQFVARDDFLQKSKYLLSKASQIKDIVDYKVTYIE